MQIYSPYSPADFQANPRKYELYKTATVARHVHTENGENDLPVGEIVGVRYFDTVRNELFKRDEPVFEIRRAGGVFWGALFANALADFVL